MATAVRSPKEENNPLNRLLQAEREAALMIEREQRNRDARLEEAEEVARRKHEERVKQEEAKFLAEEKDTIGDENVKLQQLEAETEGEKKQIEESFGKAKDQVTQMLLHFVTTCTVSLNENQRQAFLAIQRKDLEKTRKHTDD